MILKYFFIFFISMQAFSAKFQMKNIAVLADEFEFSLNGIYYDLEQDFLVRPIMKDKNGDNYMMLPMRNIIEKLSGSYSHESGGDIEIQIQEIQLKMRVGSTEAYLQNKKLEAPYPPEFIKIPGEGVYTLYFPAKFVLESLEGAVKWESRRNRLTASLITGADLTPAEESLKESRNTADMIVEAQNLDGGWPGHHMRDGKSTTTGGNTISQIKFLAKAYKETGNKKYAESTVRGIEYILSGQLENGGWSRQFPHGTGYVRNIVFNGIGMLNIMNLLRETTEEEGELAFINFEFPYIAEKVKRALEKGVNLLLRIQETYEEKKAGWCLQYDSQKLIPARGKSYEIPSMGIYETINIMRFLMKLKDPSEEIVEAVKGGADWLKEVKIEGKRVARIKDNTLEFGEDRVLVDDWKYNVWARMYGLDISIPIFAGRNGISRFDMREIPYERRVNYIWYTTSPEKFLKEEYPAWIKKMEEN